MDINVEKKHRKNHHRARYFFVFVISEKEHEVEKCGFFFGEIKGPKPEQQRPEAQKKGKLTDLVRIRS